MTDVSMQVYLAAKKDTSFIDEIKDVLYTPENDDDVAKKASFANAYAAWLIGKGKWQQFAKENEIELC